jgi:flagellin
MNAQIGGLQVASQNAQSGISLLQVAGGAMSQQSQILESIRNAALQAGNGTEDPGALQALGDQVTQSLAQLNQISQSTNFNGTNLLDGTATNLTFQTGTSGTSANQTTVSLPDTSVGGLGLSGLDSQIAAGGNMSNVLNAIDNASSALSNAQANVGATTNGLTASANNISQSITSLSGSASNISDTDIAQSVMKMTSDNIKSQFSIALMAQANSINKQNALSLLSTIPQTS